MGASLANIIFITICFAILLILLYIKYYETFESLAAAGFTYRDNNQATATEIKTVISNIKVDENAYLNVFQCRKKQTENGDTYYPIGQYFKVTSSPMNSALSTDETKSTSLSLLCKIGKEPTDYSLVWASSNLSVQPSQDFSIWRPISPAGYVSMCDYCVLGFSKPATSEVVCLPYDVIEASPVLKAQLLEVDYSNGVINATLQCWGVSSHQFFRCGSVTSSPDLAGTKNVYIIDKSTDLQNLGYNVKQAALAAV